MLRSTSVRGSVRPSVGPSGVRPLVRIAFSYRGVLEHLMPCIRPCLANFEVMFSVGKCKHDFYISLHFLVIQYIPDLFMKLKVLFCSPLLRCCLHLWHLCMCFLRSSLLILRHIFFWRRLLYHLIYNIKV